jgi:hypothetical protein
MSAGGIAQNVGIEATGADCVLRNTSLGRKLALFR